MSSRLYDGALDDRDELVSLLCTPAVVSILQGVRANCCTNTLPSRQLYSPVSANHYDNQRHQQARGSTGSRSSSQPQVWPHTAGSRTVGQYQNQQRRYSPYQHAAATRYAPVSGHRDYGHQASSSNTAWLR
jgi:hypothetical protein